MKKKKIKKAYVGHKMLSKIGVLCNGKLHDLNVSDLGEDVIGVLLVHKKKPKHGFTELEVYYHEQP